MLINIQGTKGINEVQFTVVDFVDIIRSLADLTQTRRPQLQLRMRDRKPKISIIYHQFEKLNLNQIIETESE